jgi:hypothetical protein
LVAESQLLKIQQAFSAAKTAQNRDEQ